VKCLSAVAISLLVLLTGCYSNQPLGDAERAYFDERLLGTWLSDDGETKLRVARFNKTEFVVSPVDDFNDKDAMRVFVTRVDSHYFFNAQELSRNWNDRMNLFARYEFDGDDTVVVQVPKLDALPHEVTRAAKLLKIIRDRADDAEFYTDEALVFRRL